MNLSLSRWPAALWAIGNCLSSCWGKSNNQITQVSCNLLQNIFRSCTKNEPVFVTLGSCSVGNWQLGTGNRQLFEQCKQIWSTMIDVLSGNLLKLNAGNGEVQWFRCTEMQLFGDAGMHNVWCTCSHCVSWMQLFGGLLAELEGARGTEQAWSAACTKSTKVKGFNKILHISTVAQSWSTVAQSWSTVAQNRPKSKDLKRAARPLLNHACASGSLCAFHTRFGDHCVTQKYSLGIIVADKSILFKDSSQC